MNRDCTQPCMVHQHSRYYCVVILNFFSGAGGSTILFSQKKSTSTILVTVTFSTTALILHVWRAGASFRTNASSCSSTARQASSGTEGAPGGAAGGKRATISAGTSATTTREVVIPSAPIAAGRTAGHGAPMEPMSAPSTRPELQRLPMLPKSCRSTGAWAHRGACSEQASRRRPQGMDTARQAYW